MRLGPAAIFASGPSPFLLVDLGPDLSLDWDPWMEFIAADCSSDYNGYIPEASQEPFRRDVCRQEQVDRSADRILRWKTHMSSPYSRRAGHALRRAIRPSWPRARGLVLTAESLEQRCLLSVSPYTLIATQLGTDAADLFRSSSTAAGLTLAVPSSVGGAIQQSAPLITLGDRVLVEAFPRNRQGNALDQLRRNGFEQLASFQGAASGWYPIHKLDTLATATGFTHIRPVYRPTLKAGQVTSEGDAALRANLARTGFDVDGSGITVGILSDSFNSLGGAAAGIASGDLPVEGVRVLEDLPQSFLFGGSDEGRAMAEIVHDVAPGASIMFATALLGEISFANNIIRLVEAGADVIVDDVGYFTSPFFQDGLIAQAAQFAVASGVSFFSAAGNAADESVEGNFVDSGVKDPDDKGTLHAFRPSRGTDDPPDTLQKITVPNRGVAQIILQWDSPFASAGFFGASSDLSIYIMGADGTTVIEKQDIANVGGDAIEIIAFVNDGSHDLDGQAGPDTTFNIAISLNSGSVSRFKYLYLGSITINEYNTRSSTVFGHSNARDVIAVAAAPFFSTPEFGNTTTVLEGFSSLGGTEILFDSFGFNTGAGVRLQPTLTGIDGTDNTFFGTFFGTSAAAPHLAAVAALMLDSAGGRNSLTPNDIRSVMINSAADVTHRLGPRGAPIRVPTPDPAINPGRGYDFYSGYGLVDASAAVGAVKKYAAVEGVAFSDDNGNGTRDSGEVGIPNIVVYLDGNNDRLIGYGEPAVLTDASGYYRFSDLDAGTFAIRQVVTPGYELTAPLGTVLVTIALGQFPRVDLANRPRFDFGDAPAPYATSLADNGPRHGIQDGLHLGSSVDSDFGGTVTGNGDLDDSTGLDDEDGVTLSSNFVRGTTSTIDVRATIGSNSPGVLQAWIDFDRDGQFITAGEWILRNQLLVEGSNRLPVFIPAWAVAGPTYARFRYGYERDLGPTGASRAGEVEDYRVTILNSGSGSSGVTATNDTFSVRTGSLNNLLDVLANDNSAVGSLNLAAVGGTSHGGRVEISNQRVIYSPAASLSGSESFSYTVTNGQGLSATGQVLVTVSSTAPAPVATDDSVTVPQNSRNNVLNVLANDTLPSGILSKIITVGVPDQGGSVTIQSDGLSLLYTPATGYRGTETFQYTVTSANGATDRGQVNIVVEAPTNGNVLARMQLRTTDVNDNVITSIAVGQDFHLRGLLQDVRAVPQGVFAAYLDINYPANLLTVTGPIVYAENYPNGKSGNTSVAGLIDEIGSTGNPNVLGGDQFLQFTIPLRATAAGTAVFAADGADILPRHASVLYGASEAMTAAQFELLGTSLVIGSTAPTRLSAELQALDVNRDNFIAAIDALLVINRLNQDSRRTAIGLSADTVASTLDVNRDGHISAIDALLVINHLNRQSAAAAAVPRGASIPASDVAAAFSLPASSEGDGGDEPQESWDLFAEDVTVARRRA